MATARLIEAFTEEESEELDSAVIASPATKSARIKGTWLMQWGALQFDFEDGRRYTIPTDLFDYLRSRGCIYDTMA